MLRLVACGFSNRAIADALVISRKTAANHVEHIYAKIGVSNRAGRPVRDAARPDDRHRGARAGVAAEATLAAKDEADAP